MRVELLWWEGCPSTDRALDELRHAMAATGLDPESVQVREIASEGDAEREGFPGSPTIRIDGRDVVDPKSVPIGLSCRVYRLSDGRPSPVPDATVVRDALARAAA